MNRRIVVTTGISLLRGTARPGPGDSLSLEARLRARLDEARAAGPEAVAALSAETHGLCLLGIRPGEAVAFVHSDTPEGRACAGALAAFYESLGHPATTVAAEGLGYDPAQVAERGLGSLLKVLAGEIVRGMRQGERVVLHVSGGFKAETGFALALACLFPGVEVGYVHEEMRNWLRIPTLPLAVDLDRAKPFFKLLAAADVSDPAGRPPRRGPSVKQLWDGDPEMAGYLFETVTDEDGAERVAQSGFGMAVHALYEALVLDAIEQWRPACFAKQVTFRTVTPEAVQRFFDSLRKSVFVRTVEIYPGPVEGTGVRRLHIPWIEIRLSRDGFEAVLRLETMAEDALQLENLEAQAKDLLRQAGLLP